MSGNSTTPVPTVAGSAAAFDQSIGVNAHMGYSWTLYNNVALVESDLAYLGVDHVRDEFIDSGNVQTNYQQLAADGIKFDFLIPTYIGSPNTVNISQFVSMVDAFVQAHPGSVTAIEGPNEVNIWSVNYNGGTTLADEGLLQQALYAAVRADPSLNGISIYNLTMAYTDATQDAELGNLSPWANFANSHAYLNASQSPQYSMSVILPYAQIDAPGLPTVITETGYETNVADGYSGVDQTVQAKLTLDELMDAYKNGVSQTYLYELFDEGGQYYGLFNADGTPKLAATAIHDLTTLLSDPGNASPFTPGSLSYAVPNLPANGNQLLLEKSNGTFDLVLWAEAQTWDPNTASEVAAPTETSTVEFGQTQKVVLVFDPLLGSMPIAAYLNVQSIQVTLTDHPIVIEVPSTTPTLATPTINGSSPGNVATGDGITLTGVATANSTVLVFDGAIEIGTATANASGAWSFATGTLAGGTNVFTSMVVDAAGDVSGISAALNVTISAAASAAPVTVPIIYNYFITNTNQAIVTGTAEANTTVKVFDGTTLLGTAIANASGAWSYTTPTLPNGDYTLTATATDAAGNTSAVSNAIDPIISPPPTLTSVTLSGSGITNGNGDLSTGSLATLTLTMSEVVTVTGGTPTLTLSDGDTATYTGGSGTNALTFSYTVAAGDAASNLTVIAVNANGADIEDVGGNALTGAVPNPSGVLQINMAPTVSSVGVSGLGVSSGPESSPSSKIINLVLNFSEAVTVTGGVPTLTLANGGTAVYSGGSGSSGLIFSYTLPAGQTTSSLAVKAVQLNGAIIADDGGISAHLSGALTNPVEIIAESGRGPTATSPTDIIAPSTSDPLTAANPPRGAGFVLPGGSAPANTVSMPGIAFANPLFSLVASGTTNPGLIGDGGFVQKSIASDLQATLGHLPNSNQGGDMLAATNGNNHVGVALLVNYMASSFAASGNGNSGATGVVDGSHFGSQSLLAIPQHR